MVPGDARPPSRSSSDANGSPGIIRGSRKSRVTAATKVAADSPARRTTKRTRPPRRRPAPPRRASDAPTGNLTGPAIAVGAPRSTASSMPVPVKLDSGLSPPEPTPTPTPEPEPPATAMPAIVLKGRVLVKIWRYGSIAPEAHVMTCCRQRPHVGRYGMARPTGFACVGHLVSLHLHGGPLVDSLPTPQHPVDAGGSTAMAHRPSPVSASHAVAPIATGRGDVTPGSLREPG